jgi:hypothetical protein
MSSAVTSTCARSRPLMCQTPTCLKVPARARRYPLVRGQQRRPSRPWGHLER